MTITNNQSQSVTQRTLDSLKPHPKQSDLFRDLPEQEIQCLAEDIQTNGLKHPVEILSEGTIICGHQRVAAAKRLGWTHIDVMVRTDLKAKGEKAIEEALIGDNLHRRQLDPIEKARCIERLREWHDPGDYHQRRAREKSGEAHEYEKGTFRDYLGKELGMSGRTVDRYLAVLRAPRAVQDAVSEHRLSLTEAAQVGGLSEEIQAKIAQAIQAGGNVKEVVRRHLPKKSAASVKPAPKKTQHYLSQFRRSADELIDHAAKGNSLTQDQKKILRQSILTLQKLLPKPDSKRVGGQSSGIENNDTHKEGSTEMTASDEYRA